MLIAGGTGLIGSALKTEAGKSNWEVILLSRTTGKDRITWDPDNGTIDLHSKMNFDAIVNLAGASVSKGRWSPERKNEIRESRINSCRTLENYLYDGRINTNVYVGTSAIGIYGDQGLSVVTETTPIKANDWFAKTVMDWEIAHKRIEALEIRTCIIRTGIVLSREGGAFNEILKASKWTILPYFGNGKQIWSWVHIIDIVGMMMHCIEHSDINGIFLGTAPNPVTNKKLIYSLDAYMILNRLVIGIPRVVLSLIMGEMHRVVFDSCNAPGNKITIAGYKFNYPTIDEAMKELINKKT